MNNISKGWPQEQKSTVWLHFILKRKFSFVHYKICWHLVVKVLVSASLSISIIIKVLVSKKSKWYTTLIQMTLVLWYSMNACTTYKQLYILLFIFIKQIKNHQQIERRKNVNFILWLYSKFAQTFYDRGTISNELQWPPVAWPGQTHCS